MPLGPDAKMVDLDLVSCGINEIYKRWTKCACAAWKIGKLCVTASDERLKIGQLEGRNNS